jgi:hypothetical protein
MGADCRTILVNEAFQDTFAVFGPDGFTKVLGLTAADLLVAIRYRGARMSPQPAWVLDDPDDEGEYRISVAADVFAQEGLYQIEIQVPTHKQNFATDIQVIRNLADVIQGMYMGTQTIALRVRDQAAGAVGDAAVQVFDEYLSTIVQAGKSAQSDGILTTTLDPGTYKVVVSKSLYAFNNPHVIEVANTPGVTQSFDLVGDRLTIATPVAPTLCRIYGYLMSMTGTVSDSYSVHVEGKGSGTNAYVTGAGGIDPEAQGVAQDSKTVYPNKSTGIWQIDLVRGCYVRVRIDAQRIDRSFRVPDTAVINFMDIIQTDNSYSVGRAR